MSERFLSASLLFSFIKKSLTKQKSKNDEICRTVSRQNYKLTRNKDLTKRIHHDDEINEVFGL